MEKTMKSKLLGCLLVLAASSAAIAGKLIVTDGSAVTQPAQGAVVAPSLNGMKLPLQQPGQVPLASSLSSGEVLAGSPKSAAAKNAFMVFKSDGNIRTTVGRWSRQAQWVFEPEHWTIREDVTLAGVSDAIPMNLGDDYKTAVRTLLGSTALTEQEVKPCFYSNSVVRVVYVNQKCNKAQD
jgi:Toxin co-regulated pilus biosynthesis protein Q